MLSAKKPASRKPDAISIREPGRSQRGLCRSWIQPPRVGRNRPKTWLGSRTKATIIGAWPSPFSTSIGISVVTASMDRWKQVLVNRAIEKYFCLKYPKSTKGSLLRCWMIINSIRQAKNSRCIGM